MIKWLTLIGLAFCGINLLIIGTRLDIGEMFWTGSFMILTGAGLFFKWGVEGEWDD